MQWSRLYKSTSISNVFSGGRGNISVSPSSVTRPGSCCQLLDCAKLIMSVGQVRKSSCGHVLLLSDIKNWQKEHPGTMHGWNTINLPQYQAIPKLFPALQPHEYIEKKNNALEDGFVWKWSSCRSCCVALLLGGSCGLLSHSRCTLKTQQNEQCLILQCCTRREEIHP